MRCWPEAKQEIGCGRGADRRRGPNVLEVFTYPGTSTAEAFWTECAPAVKEGEIANPLAYAAGQQDSRAEETDPAILQARLEEQKQISFEAGRQAGFEEGRLAHQRQESDRKRAGEEHLAETIAATTARFDQDKVRFFAAAEREVVRLALAVAARVLRHEATADPLLLTGSVRAALGQLAAASEVKLRVPAGDLELWQETIEHLPGLASRPELVPDVAMQSGDCVVETDLGRADLSVRSQLAEMERLLLGGAQEAEDAFRGREVR